MFGYDRGTCTGSALELHRDPWRNRDSQSVQSLRERSQDRLHHLCGDRTRRHEDAECVTPVGRSCN
jgi:hypothetical protein